MRGKCSSRDSHDFGRVGQIRRPSQDGVPWHRQLQSTKSLAGCAHAPLCSLLNRCDFHVVGLDLIDTSTTCNSTPPDLHPSAG
ncbi:hypothetical protein PsorP6_014577 [Peronosclerospora sorghi]|uniref:Uncharacterized protein n=1 Tax=Peronosclerospora sorghi TaxID=230839 RepID=A0ACC0VSA9_9STRA|nr:hypothetical protein PsorP6_014577 [Peronosclerospora sorghi]